MTAALVLGVVVGAVVGSIIGKHWPRLFPTFPQGTRVTILIGSDLVLCRYLYRSSSRYSHLQVLPGDDLGWDGRVVTARNSEIKAVSS